MVEEIWLVVNGYQGKYSVSNLGNVRNNRSNKLLKKSTAGKGYQRVVLGVDGVWNHHLLHRLVAITFLDKKEGCDEVNHIDANKTNNCVSNLEWTTRLENVRHSHRLGLNEPNQVKGSRVGSSKLTESEVLEIRRLKDSKTHEQLSEMYGVGKSNICTILKGNSWKHLLTEGI